MKHPDADDPLAAEAPLDGIDLAILDRIRRTFEAADPMPPSLAERIRFALELRDLEVEMARLTAEDDLLLSAARGEEQSRTITFDSDSLTIMIRIECNQDGTARIDGWLAPPQRCEILIRTTAEPLTAAADEQGRFAFSCVPRGTAQLVVRSAEPGGNRRTVVTPALIL
jgi:hypothetical protein